MKFNIIHIIICIFVFVGCTQQTVNNSMFDSCICIIFLKIWNNGLVQY